VIHDARVDYNVEGLGVGSQIVAVADAKLDV
jgi:hypothetical protein